MSAKTYGRVVYKGTWSAFYSWFKSMNWEGMPDHATVSFSYNTQPRTSKAKSTKPSKAERVRRSKLREEADATVQSQLTQPRPKPARTVKLKS